MVCPDFEIDMTDNITPGLTMSDSLRNSYTYSK